jgi:hypothetical protein
MEKLLNYEFSTYKSQGALCALAENGHGFVCASCLFLLGIDVNALAPRARKETYGCLALFLKKLFGIRESFVKCGLEFMIFGLGWTLIPNGFPGVFRGMAFASFYKICIALVCGVYVVFCLVCFKQKEVSVRIRWNPMKGSQDAPVRMTVALQNARIR